MEEIILIMILEDKEKNDYLQEKKQKRGKILTISFFVIWIVSFISIFMTVLLNGGFKDTAKINETGAKIENSDEIFMNGKQLSLKERKKILSIMSENYETVFVCYISKEEIANIKSKDVVNITFKKKNKETNLKLYNDFSCTDDNYCPDYYLLSVEYKGNEECLTIGKDKKMTEILIKYIK